MILVVEDDDGNRFALTDLLEMEGYEVVSVGRGRDAIEILQKQKFDLILCDIKMPGVTGYNIIQEAKQRYPETPFVFLSAYASYSDEKLGYSFGCDKYIIKPYSIEQILRTIREFLEEK